MTASYSFICEACGTQFPAAAKPPHHCAICSDDRQFVPKSGQAWTTLEELRTAHWNTFQQYDPNLFAITTTPEFAIGQSALLLRTKHGNFLWDCISLLDDATFEIIRAFGGLRGIAISHPHFYATMLEWSAAFDNAPIYLHTADREWVMHSGGAIEFWDGCEKEIAPGITLVRCGGHFRGGTVLHWAESGGALLSGDIVRVNPNGSVSFMYSYPNLIPLSADAVKEIGEVLRPFAFERIYGAFEHSIEAGAKNVVVKSVERYVSAIHRDSRG